MVTRTDVLVVRNPSTFRLYLTVPEKSFQGHDFVFPRKDGKAYHMLLQVFVRQQQQLPGMCGTEN